MTGSQQRRIAVLGAPSTGKTLLARALTEALRQTGQRLEVVIADVAPLLAAASSGLAPDNPSLHALTLQHRTSYSHTLLMGLDLPWVAQGPGSGSLAARDQADTRLRGALSQAGIVFQVVYGQGGQRLQNALWAIGAGLGVPQPNLTQKTGVGRWAWACDKCSDPACEHRLFTGLQGAA